MITNISYNA